MRLKMSTFHIGFDDTGHVADVTQSRLGSVDMVGLKSGAGHRLSHEPRSKARSIQIGVDNYVDHVTVGT